MAPKRQKTAEKKPDIRSFFGKENAESPSQQSVREESSLNTLDESHDDPSNEEDNTAQLSPEPSTSGFMIIKKENEEKEEKPEMLEKMDKPQEKHLHHFKVKFFKAKKNYNVTCRKRCTVLEAIKSHLPDEFSKMTHRADENIVIQLGLDDKKYTVATHFPCCLVDEGKILIVSSKSEEVEVIQEQQVRTFQPKDSYSVFYIDTVGGENTKTKKIFQSNAVNVFKFLCVYGEKEKGMTVKEALERDGRFCDLGNFKLSENKNEINIFNCKTLVDDVHRKEFKICLPLRQDGKKMGKNLKKNPKQEKQQEQTAAVDNSQTPHERINIQDIAHCKGKSVQELLDEQDNDAKREKIYELLREQFPDLKEWMESRFPGDSYQKALRDNNEKFGKIQQSFSEVHRIEKLLKMGKSVCKVIVSDISQGTGFVLFDRFVLTSAHLFKGCVQEKKLLDQIIVSALFNYDEPEPETNYFYFSAENTFVDIDFELDYAVLELKPEGQRPNSKTKPKNVKVPPGLLNKFGPLPGNGEACLIGHPAGSVKKIDPTCIIEPEKREQAVKDHLAKYKDQKVINKLVNEIKKQGIDKIMIGGEKAEKVATFNTFMYDGASGSPVFDAHGQIFGLHTGGYTYEVPNIKGNVIEYAHPLLTIFERFVINLKESGNDQMLEKVEEAVTENRYLKNILQMEPMEVD